MIATSSSKPLPKVGIISIGDMGSGLARLLVAHDYSVATNCTGRSQDTTDRAIAAGVELLLSDEELVSQCVLILSVVPPRDAIQTAQRILSAISSPKVDRSGRGPLYFADMNAISPATCRAVAALFSDIPDSILRFIDGSILGGPPSPLPSTPPSSTNPTPPTQWTRPSLPTSGPYPFSLIHPSLPALLNNTHISPVIGAASGLKMCFASLSKGWAAISLQAVTTAYRLGVLPHLVSSLQEIFPANLARMERAVCMVGPKAYRWVGEMREISRTHAVDGGFVGDGEEEEEGNNNSEEIFEGAAGVFEFVAEETVLGLEKMPIVAGLRGEAEGGGGKGKNKRVRGTTIEDVARCMAEGMEERETKRRMRIPKGAGPEAGKEISEE